nr:hypothetical protein CFP56_04031 [Quercus suber]
MICSRSLLHHLRMPPPTSNDRSSNPLPPVSRRGFDGAPKARGTAGLRQRREFTEPPRAVDLASIRSLCTCFPPARARPPKVQEWHPRDPHLQLLPTSPPPTCFLGSGTASQRATQHSTRDRACPASRDAIRDPRCTMERPQHAFRSREAQARACASRACCTVRIDFSSHHLQRGMIGNAPPMHHADCCFEPPIARSHQCPWRASSGRMGRALATCSPFGSTPHRMKYL